jgi:hypothetical protein
MALTYGTSIHVVAFHAVTKRSNLEGLSEPDTFSAEFLRH